MTHSAGKDARQSAESGAGLPPRHGGYKGTPGYDGPWPPVAPKGPGGGSPGTADSDAGCVECGNAVDRALPDPIPEGYECMWSEAMTGRALYCLACYSDTTPGGQS